MFKKFQKAQKSDVKKQNLIKVAKEKFGLEKVNKFGNEGKVEGMDILDKQKYPNELLALKGAQIDSYTTKGTPNYIFRISKEDFAKAIKVDNEDSKSTDIIQKIAENNYIDIAEQEGIIYFHYRAGEVNRLENANLQYDYNEDLDLNNRKKQLEGFTEKKEEKKAVVTPKGKFSAQSGAKKAKCLGFIPNSMPEKDLNGINEVLGDMDVEYKLSSENESDNPAVIFLKKKFTNKSELLNSAEKKKLNALKEKNQNGVKIKITKENELIYEVNCAERKEVEYNISKGKVEKLNLEINEKFPLKLEEITRSNFTKELLTKGKTELADFANALTQYKNIRFQGKEGGRNYIGFFGSWTGTNKDTKEAAWEKLNRIVQIQQGEKVDNVDYSNSGNNKEEAINIIVKNFTGPELNALKPSIIGVRGSLLGEIANHFKEHLPKELQDKLEPKATQADKWAHRGTLK